MKITTIGARRPLIRRWRIPAIVISLTIWLSSTGTPWLIGQQREPRWAWALGSGRLKLWWSSDHPADRTWTTSWYRGLDGRPIRWDITFSRNVVNTLALPLWPLPLAFAVVALRGVRSPRPGLCLHCRYDLTGNTTGTCPECGRA